MEKRVDAALTDAFAADIGDENACASGDSIAHLGRDRGRGENAGGCFGLIDPAIVADRNSEGRYR